MLPLIMAVCGAAGAVAGAVTTHAANEKDRQTAKRYEKVNTELINCRDKLQKQYYELSDKSQQQINDLNLKLAQSEMEKDAVYLALNLYHELMALREDIDINPSFEVLVEFHKAIVLTNYVLQQLDKRLVPVSQDYFRRTLNRIDERDNLSKQQLFDFMAVLMNPQQDTVMNLLDEVQKQMPSDVNEFTEATMEANDNEEIYNVTTEEWINRRVDFNKQKQHKRAVACQVYKRVKTIVIDQLKIDEETVTPEANFAYDLGADSLDIVELIMALEDEFVIEIPDKIAKQIDTVGEAVELIAANIED